MNQKSLLSSQIRKACTDAGFIKCGFSKAENLIRESAYLKEWLDENRNAGMKWMNNNFEKRTCPELILENVKSVISLALLYDTPFSHSDDPGTAKISRYAWGKKDYHKIIKNKLKHLCKEIESLSPGIKTRFYVDDGPVMEKAWAARSGIGWHGKNTNVINKDYGSFFFLSEIFTDAELDYDKPAEDLCGSCRLCIDACPTGALFEEYRLDAGLCISYHTIENRDEIPENIRLNGWIFGCDICQDVCPFNGKKVFTEDSIFSPRENIFNRTFDELLVLSEDEFNNTFEGTPVRRTKYSGWTRNLKKAREEQ